MNPYEELGVTKNATTEEIKQRYRVLAQFHHPDKGGDEEVFKRIKLAYEILSDPIRRKEYDTTGKSETTRSIRNEALEKISQMLFHIVSNFNPEQDNLIALMKDEVHRMKNEVVANISVCNLHLERLNKVIERISIRTDDENLLTGLLQRQIESRKQENLEFVRRMEICDLVLQILDDYDYGLMTLMHN